MNEPQHQCIDSNIYYTTSNYSNNGRSIFMRDILTEQENNTTIAHACYNSIEQIYEIFEILN